MRAVVFIIFILASFPLQAENKTLPQHFDMTELKLDKIPMGKELTINAIFNIPNNHKTTGNGSTLRVYERVNDQWNKVATLRADQLQLDPKKVSISGKVRFTSRNSDIAIDSTFYHCGKYCVINNFQGVTKRDPQRINNNLIVKLDGYLPTDKMKKN